jgi:hypothetical protein
MAIESPVSQGAATGTYPYALLRAGFPYYTTLGMRRVTTACMDVALGGEGRFYAISRDDGQGGLIRRSNWDDEDLGTISGAGTEPGKLMWPVQLILDKNENLYVSDEGTHRISAFNRDGELLGHWGEAGSGPGQFEQPWGIHVDMFGDVYIGDWGNDRVQKLTADGKPLLSMGRSGSGDGELRRPAGVAVDEHGDIYVADRGNHRVLMFDKTGRYVEKFIGDATISKSGRKYILSNPKVLRGREMTTLEIQKRLRGPASVRVVGDLLYIPDFGSHRIQVYKKEAYVLTEADIWPEQNHPFLYNV